MMTVRYRESNETHSSNAQRSASLPSVSVVIPVYNGERTIRQCLDALLQVSYPQDRLEIIVVDNNSTDGTPDIVAEYPVTLIYERNKQTSYAARNAGIQRAAGDIVAFTDADCVADPGWLEALVQPFTNRSVAGVLGKVASFEPTGLVEAFTVKADPLGYTELGGLVSMITANVAYRRDVLSKLGGFRSELPTGADIDLGWRVQRMPDAEVEYVPTAIVYHMHRTTLAGLHRQYYRYGYSEILLDTLYRGQTFYPRTVRKQLGIMLRQIKALFTYTLSFLYRLVRSAITGWDIEYVALPILWFAAESSTLMGKVRGLCQTRWFTRDLLEP